MPPTKISTTSTRVEVLWRSAIAAGFKGCGPRSPQGSPDADLAGRDRLDLVPLLEVIDAGDDDRVAALEWTANQDLVCSHLAGVNRDALHGLLVPVDSPDIALAVGVDGDRAGGGRPLVGPRRR